MAMDPEAKARWIAALRSGDYKQGKDALEDAQGCNCCLGVLAIVEGVKKTHHEIDEWKFVRFQFEGYDSDAEAFTPINWRGLTESNISQLVHLNDFVGLSFEQIADYIEENL